MSHSNWHSSLCLLFLKSPTFLSMLVLCIIRNSTCTWTHWLKKFWFKKKRLYSAGTSRTLSTLLLLLLSHTCGEQLSFVHTRIMNSTSSFTCFHSCILYHALCISVIKVCGTSQHWGTWSPGRRLITTLTTTRWNSPAILTFSSCPRAGRCSR